MVVPSDALAAALEGAPRKGRAASRSASERVRIGLPEEQGKRGRKKDRAALRPCRVRSLRSRFIPSGIASVTLPEPVVEHANTAACPVKSLALTIMGCHEVGTKCG